MLRVETKANPFKPLLSSRLCNRDGAPGRAARRVAAEATCPRAAEEEEGPVAAYSSPAIKQADK